ncbi:MAG: hypothetical protein HY304_06125 [candidate division Zixibacteria bacterium]|nr:hypothetical protein [candidate division Zixibacteria bacterium]
MKNAGFTLAAIFSLGIVSAGSLLGAERRLPTAVGTIPIGGLGGWGWLTVDTAAHRLYVSHSRHAPILSTQAPKDDFRTLEYQQ